MTSLKRPLIGTGTALALVSSVGAFGALNANGAPADAADATATALPEGAATQAAAFTATQMADAQRLASSRTASNVSRSEVRETERVQRAQRAAERRALARREAARQAAAQAKAEREARKAEQQRQAEARKAELQREAEAKRQAAAPVVATGGSNQQIAAGMLASYGWGQDQMSCLSTLWTGESNWNHLAMNASSGAYGIPQSLPGSKMASAGADWQTNPATQIKWGLGYISERYGSPCGALGAWQSRSPHWY